MRVSATLASVTAATFVLLASVAIGFPAQASPEPVGADAALGAAAGGRVAGALAGPLAAPAPITVDLCAVEGTLTLPDGSPAGLDVDVWGFALEPVDGCANASAEVPGPVLRVQAGAMVTINLENQLDDPVSILFHGQPLVPDTDGAAANGGTTTYEFVADAPGTFLYEAGRDVARQVAMGLYGAFVVEPECPAPPCQAYDDPSTVFDADSVLVLSEIDPALNADPQGFDLLDYSPEYWLINGKAYPDTAPIPATGGERILVRYVNAGLRHHTMMLLGMHETFVAKDGFPSQNPVELFSETIPAGSTADAIVTIPEAAADTRFPLYNRQLHLTNGTTANPDQIPGGMMTFFEVA